MSQWKSVKLVTLGWSIFLAENIILSENRTAIIETVGDKNYHRLYNTLSLSSTCLILYGYVRHGRNKGPTHKLWNPAARPVKLAAFSLRAAGLIGISQQLPKVKNPFTQVTSSSASSSASTNQKEWISQGSSEYTKGHLQNSDPKPKGAASTSGCPIDFQFGKDRKPGEIWGMKRITRHPQLFSLGLTCISFTLASSYYSHLVFWSMPLLFAFVGGAHQDSRYRRGMGGYLSREQESLSSLIPFQALLQGKQKWSDLAADLKEMNAILAIGLAALTTLL